MAIYQANTGVSYDDTFNSLDWVFENKVKIKGKMSEEQIYEYFDLFRTYLDNTINNILLVNKTNEKEEYIRKLCRYVIKNLLPICNQKIAYYNSRKNPKNNSGYMLSSQEMILFNNWLDMEDDLFAIASMRSLTHYALYLERDDPLDQKVWCYILNDVMGGIFYYANQMILNGKYQNLFKQCPTGYGKSKSDCNIICYILGYDPNASIMKVVGNPRLVGEMTENVVKMLQSPRHAKVFKQYAKEYEKMKDKDDIFTTLSKKDGLFKLKMSKKARTFLCVNKDTDIDGTRYDYQFFDDITQSKDRENVNRHMMDRDKFTGQWRKRASSEYEVRRFFTGTAYHIEDFLSYCKNYYSNQQPLIVDVDTIYFKWRKFCKLSKDKNSVYIMVPKLADLDLGEESCYCTFPQKYTKREALNMLHGSLGSVREFWAMEQQQPLPPETLAFDYAYLQTYSILPKDILEKRALTKMIIDPSRKGNDNFAGLIFKQSSIENTDKYYFTSCYYQKKSGKVALPNIADLIVEHKVDVIYIENNIDCVQLLEQELEKRKYFNYKIKEFYSYMKKDEKIAKYRDDIRDLIIFPIQRMYHFDSDMGRALKDITSYRLDGNNANDDSIDCCAMFCEQESENMENEVEIFDFDFSLR